VVKSIPPFLISMTQRVHMCKHYLHDSS